MGLTGQVLNHLRRHRLLADGMTQAELADRVGVTRQTIHSIEKGKFVPSTLLAFKIALFFDTPVDQVFFIVDN